jgi:anthranilate phosphoribosyltransferase
MMGVYDPALCEPVAKTLGLLGRRSAWVVHGSGLDEVAVHGPTTVARYEHGAVELDTITPEDAGLDRYPLEAIRGRDPEQNADAIRAVLGGQGAAAHEAVVAMNAGTLAWLCGQAPNLKDGTALALDTLRSGRAASRLDRWIEVCREIC